MGVPEDPEHQSLGMGCLQLAVGGGVEGRPGNSETDVLACLVLCPCGGWHGCWGRVARIPVHHLTVPVLSPSPGPN